MAKSEIERFLVMKNEMFRQAKILIVGDEIEQVDGLGRLLQGDGYGYIKHEFVSGGCGGGTNGE